MDIEQLLFIINGRLRRLSEAIGEVKDMHPIVFKGAVTDIESLPKSPKTGDMYNIAAKSQYGEAGQNVAWTGTEWDPMGATVDMSLYLSREDAKREYQPAGNYLDTSDIDKTLSKEGKAADAKTTGEAIKEIHPIAELSGAAEYTATNTVEAPVVIKEIAGKTKQNAANGSPSPDDPQEIQGVGDSGSVTVVAQGKNLFSGFAIGKYLNSTTGEENNSADGAASNYIEVDFSKNDSYLLSGLSDKFNSYVVSYDANKIPIGRTEGSHRKQIVLTEINLKQTSFNNNRTIRYIRVTEYKTSSDTEDINTLKQLKTQLEPGSAETSYQPYDHSEITISLRAPLYEGDKICFVRQGESYVDSAGSSQVADRALYGVYRENAAAVFDGSEDEAWFTNENNVNLFRIMKFAGNKDKDKTIISDKLKSETAGWVLMNDRTIQNVGGAVGIKMLSIFTVDEFKTSLQTSPVTAVFKLITPYFEPFEDQSIFYNLRSTGEFTYIYTEDPLSPEITVDVARNQTGAYLLESYAEAQTSPDVYLGKEEAAETYQPKGSYLEDIPAATEESIGGIKAKPKTTESVEAAIDPDTGKMFVPQFPEGLAQDDTAETILAKLNEIAPYLQQMTENGGQATGLNGFSFLMNEDGSVNITYKDPITQELKDSKTLPTNTTLEGILQSTKEIVESLTIIQEGTAV